MEDRNRLPPDGGGNPKLSGSAHQSEQNAEVRREVREQVDLTSAHAKIRKEEISDVPRKVPRFQYVDFPSLHQCIQQLSVPPLDGWLASCQLGKAPGHSPASPKEKVPKFKYVDYPSLHRCIQQLSVPPLESWSSSLLRARAEGGSTDSAKPSLSDSLRMNQGSGTRSQGKRERSPSPERPLPWQHPGKSNPATSSGSLPSNSSSHCEEKDRVCQSGTG
ncbi:uncharacterized protein si:ch211-284e13.6 [Chanos chanos]|uniref:Uncharacterized protein si:ch211-284e13.6 n=1 Tax=Chanos chanos TaxID=29144 RepID=A0A6J2W4D7_CHACN|nr:uncharacterized protein LOC115819599 [Chanos chanos]